MLDRLLIEDRSEGRLRSNSFNATVENLILSMHDVDHAKFMKPRGSMPTIPTLYNKQFSIESSPTPTGDESPEIRRSISGEELNTTDDVLPNDSTGEESRSCDDVILNHEGAQESSSSPKMEYAASITIAKTSTSEEGEESVVVTDDMTEIE